MVLTMSRWVGKVAVVTGASAGIGAAIADQLVEDGIIVVGLARRVERIEARAKELTGKKGKLIGYQTDMSVEAEIVKAFKWIRDNVGPVSILINSAEIIEATELINGDTAKWKKLLDVNVLGLCIATSEAIKQMKAEKINGHVIHINSILGHGILCNFPGLNVYPATKHAVTALTETLRKDLGRENLDIKITVRFDIRWNVSPGNVRTEFIDVFYENTDPVKLSEIKKKLETMPTLAASDIADGVQYVLSTPEHVQVHELIIKPLKESY